jgi:hypothetical protein
MERNACVECRHYQAVGSRVCRHPAHVGRQFDRILGWQQFWEEAREIRQRQDTDACPHWEAK